MMQRRKFLVGMGTLAAGSAAALGTGAFTSVQADRGVTVQTTGDDSAYLKLDGDTEYVTDNNGELVIDLGGPLGNGYGGSAFNYDAATRAEGVVTVRNQGPNDLSVSLQGDGGNVSVVGDVSNVDLNWDEGIYFAVSSPTIASGDAAFIDVAIVEEPNDGDSQIGSGSGGTLRVLTS